MKWQWRTALIRLRSILAALVCALLSMLWQASPAAAERPRLEVRFAVTEPAYLANYHDATLDSVAASITDSLVFQLQKNIGFSDFVVAGTAAAAGADTVAVETLVVELTNEFPGVSGGLQAVLFRIRLEPEMNEHHVVTWPFLSADVAHQDIPPIAVLSETVRLHLNDPDLHALISQSLLRHVSITELAQFMKFSQTTLAWIIPFRREELCIDPSSVLSFRCGIKIGPGVVIEHECQAEANGVVQMSEIQPMPAFLPYQDSELVLCIVSPHRNKAAVMDALGRATPQSIVVKAVYITEYQKNDNECAIVPPADVDFSSGGGGQ